MSKGLTLDALAADAEVDRAHLGLVETAQYGPTVDFLERVAAVLEIDVAALFVAIPEGEPAPTGLRPGRKPKKPRTT